MTFEKIASYPPTHPARYPSDTFYESYSTADVNRDGHLDMIERAEPGQNGEPGEIIVWQGHDDGTFTIGARDPFELTDPWGSKSFSPSEDFNEDGLADLVIPNSDHTRLIIRPGLPGGGWGGPTDSISGDPLISLEAIGDLDGDGHLDIIAARFSNDKGEKSPTLPMIKVLGRGDGTFANGRKLGLDYCGPLSLLDWNGDGIVDILMDSTVLHIAYGKGGGSFAEEQSCFVGGEFGATRFVDVNQDGRFDMLWIPHLTKRLATAFGQGGCDFTPRTDYTFSFDELVGFVMGDLDGDGVTDLLVGGRSVDPSSYPLNNRYITTMALLTGRADGTFARQPDLAIPWPEYGPTIADVNGDGRADIVNAGSAGIEVYANACVP